MLIGDCRFAGYDELIIVERMRPKYLVTCFQIRAALNHISWLSPMVFPNQVTKNFFV